MNRYAAVILAAGQGTRFRATAATFKLVAPLRGEPLVRRVARVALASEADPVVVVTGHEAEAVTEALAGLAATLVHNPAYAAGLSTSLRCGIAAVPADRAGAVVLLADMPALGRHTVDTLVAAARRTPDAGAVVPVQAGRRGNPVLLARALFPAVGTLTGDAGARKLLAAPDVRVVEVECPGGIFDDVDHPDDLARLLARQSDDDGDDGLS